MRRLAVWWSLWRYGTHAALNAVASACCYLVGWHLSNCSSAMPLARAGALATVIAVGFTVWDYRAALAGSEQQAYELMKRVTQAFPLTGKASLADVERRLKANTRRASKVITAVHAVVLMIATFVWGFGDLATHLMGCPS